MEILLVRDYDHQLTPERWAELDKMIARTSDSFRSTVYCRAHPKSLQYASWVCTRGPNHPDDCHVGHTELAQIVWGEDLIYLKGGLPHLVLDEGL